MKGTLNTNAQAVLDAVKGADNHPTAADIYEAVRVIRPRMGLASVYRILHMLVAQGWIKEIQHCDETCRYDARTDRHDHAICTTCGALVNVPAGVCIPQDQLESAANTAGIKFSSYELLLYGVCAACAQKEGTQ